MKEMPSLCSDLNSVKVDLSITTTGNSQLELLILPSVEFFQVLQTANPPQRIQILPPFPAPKTQAPIKRRVKNPRKSKRNDANERKVRLLIVESSLLLPSLLHDLPFFFFARTE